MYNLLPQEVVDTEDVRMFQAKLQSILKDQASSNQRNWENHFSPRHVLHLHPLAKGVNEVVTIHATSATAPGTIGIATKVDVPQKIEMDRPPSWWGSTQ